MMSMNRFAYNLELWFWSVVINIFSSSSDRVNSPALRALVGLISLRKILNAIMAAMIGLLLGFALGALFL